MATDLMIISISVDLRILCTEFYLYYTYRARILCEEYNIHMYLCPYVKTWHPLEVEEKDRTEEEGITQPLLPV